MQKVTIYRHADWSARISPWADQDKMTPEEISPVGADIIIYTTLHSEVVEYLKNATKDRVSELLSDFLP